MPLSYNNRIFEGGFMNGVSILKDASEIVHYNNPNIPLYLKDRWLSSYTNMEALCHWHEDIEYMKALKGHMVYYVNGEKLTIHENDALIVNTRQMHYGFSDDKTDCYFACIVFRLHLLCTNPELTEKYIHPIAEHPNLPYIRLHAANPAEAAIIRLFDAACEDCRKGSAGYELMVISRLTAAWVELYRLLSPGLLSYSSVIEDDLSIQRNMISYIYQNYAQKLSLNDIAAAGSICRSKCCRIFKKYLNKTPIDFLNAYRLEVSTRLLTDTAMSITEIALSCGFQSPSYYAELFQHHKGCTPSHYRTRQAKGYLW